MKQLIGLDLDGIIGDTDTIFRDYATKFLGRKVEREHITTFLYEESLGITEEQTFELWKMFHDDSAWEKIELVDGVKETLARLKDNFEFVVVTSRPAVLYDVTKQWLDDNRVPYSDLVVNSEMSKAEIIKSKNWDLAYFVEDRFDFAMDISKDGTPVFLYNYPWNIKFDVPEKIIRVNNWKEIEENILKRLKIAD